MMHTVCVYCGGVVGCKRIIHFRTPYSFAGAGSARDGAGHLGITQPSHSNVQGCARVQSILCIFLWVSLACKLGSPYDYVTYVTVTFTGVSAPRRRCLPSLAHCFRRLPHDCSEHIAGLAAADAACLDHTNRPFSPPQATLAHHTSHNSGGPVHAGWTHALLMPAG
jgi:hypothetical protein